MGFIPQIRGYKIMTKITLPTGVLFTKTYSKGELETLSIGDYGKSKNIKAQFLGFNNDLNGVPNTDIAPLSEKWVVTLSTQYGCTQKCVFCDVPNVKFNGNATYEDMERQLMNALACFPDVKYTERLNIHYARMGEPMMNFKNVFNHAHSISTTQFKYKLIEDIGLRIENIHPVFTTMLPTSVSIHSTFCNLKEFCDLKNNEFRGQAGLQLSINSTNDAQREKMFQGSAHDLFSISEICKKLPEPLGRKYCLNFALADDYEVDAKRLKELFNPDFWMVKITPIHKNTSCELNGIKTTGGYNEFVPYKQAEQDLINEGFDVLIFIPSEDEENSTITCGNAILGGSKIKL